MGQPLIDVQDARFEGREELLLHHHFEGVELDEQYTQPTSRNLYKIWKRPVHLATKRKSKRGTQVRGVLISFNGTDFNEADFELN